MQRPFRRNTVSGMLLTDTATPYRHVWRPAMEAEALEGMGFPRGVGLQLRLGLEF
jgi:hypothetical protein